MARSSLLHAASVTATAVVSFAPVNAHIYLLRPLSRQLWSGPAFQERDYPNLETCPHCYNSRGPVYIRERAIAKTDPSILESYGEGNWPLKFAYDMGEVQPNGNFLEREEVAVRHGACGDPEQFKDESSNLYGTPNVEWPILSSYEQGGILEIKAVMNTYHWGHIEFSICNSQDLSNPDGVVTQGCFNSYPLTRTPGDDTNSPIDPNYPGRYYVDPECREGETEQEKPPLAPTGYVMHMKYDLPDDLVCERCILQMVYYTGNSCKHVGYDEFNPSSWPSQCAPNKEKWIDVDTYVCAESPDDVYPEEFWACADIEITSDGLPTVPTPASPTPQGSPETPAPYNTVPADCGGEWAKCGGTGWEGSTCCVEGVTCVYKDEDSSNCVPDDYPREPTATPTAEDCGGAWAKCGGTGWEGATCCETGITCVYKDKDSSNCVPDDYPNEPATAPTTEDCGEAWAKCGGTGWEGPTCCQPGITCAYKDKDSSNCVPDNYHSTPAEACGGAWAKCGGTGWEGSTCCDDGITCVYKDQDSSNCVPDDYDGPL